MSQKNNRKVTKAIITAAGFGTRFLPATKTVPKEMLPILEYPTIHYVVKELVDSGITDIVLVVRKSTPALESYFDVADDIEGFLKEGGKDEILKKVQYGNNIANFAFIKQDVSLPKGSGAAVFSAKRWVGDENFAMVYCDDLVLSKEPAIGSLIQTFQKDENIDGVIAAQEVDWEEVYKYGIVEFKEGSESQLGALTEKPSRDEAKTNLASYGRFVLTPKFFDYLDPIKVVEGKEFNFSEAIHRMAQNEKVLVEKVDGEWLTTGDPLNMLKASIKYALSRGEYDEAIRDFMLLCTKK
jgi:UTP--glucose-1-phosphate uridylyltransferase